MMMRNFINLESSMILACGNNMGTINQKEVKLLKEIADLEEQSWSIRDQIDTLETQEAKISEAINVKKRQLDAIRLYTF